MQFCNTGRNMPDREAVSRALDYQKFQQTYAMGAALRKARAERQLSQEGLANEIPCSRSSISRWERGEAFPDSETLIRLGEVLGVDMPQIGSRATVLGNTVLRDSMPHQTRPLKAFISYKSEDSAHNQWVERLATDLRIGGVESILDKWQVRYGDSFTDYMAQKISEADVFLFIITPSSVAAVESPQPEGGAVKFEMQMATARRTAGEDMRLIGIYRAGHETPAHLRDHRYADFRDDTSYDDNLNRLLEDLLDQSVVPEVRDQSALRDNQSEDRSSIALQIIKRPGSKCAIGPTTIRFYDAEGLATIDVDLGVSVELVLDATWAGEYIELRLGSTAQRSQTPSMYHTFLENYSVQPSFAKKTDLDGLDQAMWLFELDVVLIGASSVEDRLSALIGEHNDEILRIRRLNMEK